MSANALDKSGQVSIVPLGHGLPVVFYTLVISSLIYRYGHNHLRHSKETYVAGQTRVSKCWTHRMELSASSCLDGDCDTKSFKRNLKTNLLNAAFTQLQFISSYFVM